MTKSTLFSLSKGFAELSTDGQFLQLRSKQVWSRRITGVSDGILQGTEALAEGVAFGVSGVVRKPVESTRQYGLLRLAHGLGHAFLGIFVQPLSGSLDFVSLTVDGVGANFSRCMEILNNRTIARRIRNPRAFHADGIVMEYSENEGVGQVWRHCPEDYSYPVSIWFPRAPDGFVAVGCVAVAGYEEPELDSAYCVSAGMAEETSFEERRVWTAPDSYPWACHIYQVGSEALHFVALRQQKEDSDWKPMRVSDHQSLEASSISDHKRMVYIISLFPLV